jgi:hypothetical protein
MKNAHHSNENQSSRQNDGAAHRPAEVEEEFHPLLEIAYRAPQAGRAKSRVYPAEPRRKPSP